MLVDRKVAEEGMSTPPTDMLWARKREPVPPPKPELEPKPLSGRGNGTAAELLALPAMPLPTAVAPPPLSSSIPLICNLCAPSGPNASELKYVSNLLYAPQIHS